MKITLDRLNEGISQFVRGDLIYNAKSDGTKFRLGFLLGLGVFAVTPDKLAQLSGTPVLDESGAIDVDALKRAVYAGFEAAGSLPVPQAGVTLDRADADRFFHILETGAVG